MTKRKLSDIQWEFLRHVSALIVFADLKGFKLTGGELKRTMLQQRQYLREGKSETLNSDHLVSLAIDFNLFFDYDNDGDKDYLGAKGAEVAKELGEYWKFLHPDNYWGGDWGWDSPHFGRKA